jgi:hypothetical protein
VADQHAKHGDFKEIDLMRRHGGQLLAMCRPLNLAPSERLVGVPFPLFHTRGE